MGDRSKLSSLSTLSNLSIQRPKQTPLHRRKYLPSCRSAAVGTPGVPGRKYRGGGNGSWRYLLSYGYLAKIAMAMAKQKAESRRERWQLGWQIDQAYPTYPFKLSNPTQAILPIKPRPAVRMEIPK